MDGLQYHKNYHAVPAGAQARLAIVATVQIRCHIFARRTLEETVCPACWRPYRMARIPKHSAIYI